MLLAGAQVDGFIGEGDAEAAVDVTSLTRLFFVLFVLCATQDIAVDGWALTMLQRRNVGHASTTNAVGQNLGYFISFTVRPAPQSFRLSSCFLPIGHPEAFDINWACPPRHFVVPP